MQTRFSIQTAQLKNSIKLSHRCVLVLFIQEICSQFNLRKDTLFMAVYLLDRYLSEVPVSDSKLSVCTYACLHIAMKYEEIYPPLLKDYTPEQQRQEIILAESSVLKHLNFDLTYDGPAKYLELWGELLGLSDVDR